MNEWQLEHNRKKLEGNILYTKCMERCVNITGDAVEDVEELICTQEEADTQVSKLRQC